MNKPDIDRLKKQLHQLQQLEPPPEVVSNVMERLRPPQKSLWQRLLLLATTPRLVTLQPIRVATTVALMAAMFWLGTLTGVHQQPDQTSPGKVDFFDKAMLDSQASFFIGRGLMAAGLTAEALPLLQNAATAAPNNPEFAYWEGLCHWANGNFDMERSSYLRGIQASPNTVPLLLNLGHNFLEQKEFDAALTQYSKVLSQAPSDQTALYNRGLIYRLQQQTENEIAAWRSYLQYHRSGQQPLRAVAHLNAKEDFSYRVYRLGGRKVILSQSALLTMAPRSEFDHDIEVLAESLLQDSTLRIDIVSFHEGDSETARRKASTLKKNIVAIVGEKEKKRVRLSWFGEKEKLQGYEYSFYLAESLLIFGSKITDQQKETEI